VIASPFWAAVLLAVPARAQTRAAAADAASIVGPNVSVGGGLTSGFASAPTAITLNLMAPSVASAGSAPVAAPTAHAAPALAAAPLAAPLASPAVALPVALPLAAAPVASEGAPSPLMAPVQKILGETGPDGVSKMDETALISLTKKLFGEDARGAAALPAYLRPDQPLAFGAQESAAYKDARTPAQRVTAAAALLTSAGVANQVEGERVRIVPVKDGTPLNQLAWDLQRAHGASVAYDPGRLGDSGVAAYNHGLNTLFLPHFGHSKSYAAVLHESHHSQYAARQSRGDLSPFHASVVASYGAVVPGVVYYSNYMSFEETTAHAKTIKHLLAAARQAHDASYGRLSEIDAEVIKAADVSRTAAIVARRMLVELDDGTPVVPVPADHWALPELGPIAGGTWHMMRLPWNTLFIPVLDEPAPAPRSALAKLFKKKPLTAAQRAVRATAQTMLGYLRETSPLIGQLHEAINAPSPDLEGLNALADKMSLAGPRAEKAFSASRPAE
jgi:hypothetical protein